MSIDAQYKLETAEQVDLDFDLAGPGSRFCAWVIDVLLMALGLGVVAIAALLMFIGGAWWGAGGLERVFGGWAVAAIIVAVFAVTTCYHVFFEAVMRGQTPGKRQMKLRAIREEGVAMSFTDVLVRNLLRVVDFMPLFYLVGGLVSLFHPMHKRLGDLAAGTIVVKEEELDYRARSDRSAAAPIPVIESHGNGSLPAGERQLIERFLARREELTLGARSALAERLGRSLYERHGGHWGDAESYLGRLLEGRQHEP